MSRLFLCPFILFRCFLLSMVLLIVVHFLLLVSPSSMFSVGPFIFFWFIFFNFRVMVGALRQDVSRSMLESIARVRSAVVIVFIWEFYFMLGSKGNILII